MNKKESLTFEVKAFILVFLIVLFLMNPLKDSDQNNWFLQSFLGALIIAFSIKNMISFFKGKKVFSIGFNVPDTYDLEEDNSSRNKFWRWIYFLMYTLISTGFLTGVVKFSWFFD